MVSNGVGGAIINRTPLASLTFLTGSKKPTTTVSFNAPLTRSGLLHCSFLAPSSSLSSSFSGDPLLLFFVFLNLLYFARICDMGVNFYPVNF